MLRVTTGCKSSGKMRYAHQMDADMAARRKSNKHGVMLRAYRCPDCGGWHLTKRAR